jgi:diaminopimelate decarboxylase
MSADLVSPGEIYTAAAAGFPPEKMYFHGNNKTDEDIRFALEYKVGWFIVDNYNELEALDRIAGEMGIIQDILLRITVGIDPHTQEKINTGRIDSQFGVPIETGQAEGFVLAAIAAENIDVKGFHSHIGSQIFESGSFCDQADILIGFASMMREKHGFTAGIFNIGGGFGVRYTEDDPAVDIGKNIEEISVHIKRGCQDTGFPEPVIYMEPGRSIVADAGVTLYEAGGIKTVEGYREYVTVDGGMTDNPRFALYKSDYTVVNASKADGEADFMCTVAGRCCESGDRIAEDIKIARPERGDVIAVLGTGAYNYAMAMNYNRVPRPAMIFISEGKDRLVVRRQTFEDLIECEL